MTILKVKQIFAGYILNEFVWNGFDDYNRWWKIRKLPDGFQNLGIENWIHVDVPELYHRIS